VTTTTITELDPVTFEVINSALGSLADEMAFVITRTAHSEIIREVMDFSTSICDRSGSVVAQGLTIPLHMFAISHTVGQVLERYGDDVKPDDVYITNDPYEGGTHLPDVTIVRPAFLDRVLLGFVAVVAHQTDIGGRVAGSNAADSTEIYAEGLRMPPLKLYDAGTPSDAIYRIIEKNVRAPERVLGDINSQVAACAIGARGLEELAHVHGSDSLQRYMDALLDYSEALTRREIAEFPDGRYEFTDHIDSDAFASGPLPIHITLEVRGSDVVVDFAGSAAQVKGAINSVLPFTRAAVCSALRCVLLGPIPNNDGYLRPITVTAPLGSLLNPELPAAVAARALTAYRVADATFGALAQVVPERVMAAGEGGNTVVCIGGYDRARKPFILVDMVNGNWGGRAGLDGLEGVTNPTQNLNTTPIEVIEQGLPVRIEEWGFVPDTEGAGEYRGGLALVRQYRFRGEEAVLQVRSDRRDFPPYGLAGGAPGSGSLNVVNPGTTHESVVAQTVTMEIRQDDVFRHVLAGAGGYGDPLERAPERVLLDLRLEKVSPTRARDVYGVVLAPDGQTVDETKTAELRSAMRLERTPVVEVVEGGSDELTVVA
jgi:N-methylhydantoinase B